MDEKAIQKIAGWVLRIGTLLTCFLIMGGFLLHFVRHDNFVIQGRLARPRLLFFILKEIQTVQAGGWAQIRSFDLIQGGLFTLLVTPYACLLLLFLNFLWRRSLVYGIITLFILVTLGYHLFG